ncbi:arginine--tRNA ligase [Paenisporosarcina quisquiliarum]|uniref:Arginine--tRNA ligase n=1 Tax=Paenisporosarcina quisquiliarum TaxID=365346 RepID=A0A9X3REN9_9BACL|nr:arginine--tRNA ligase [Paenisporosarcina quisquiliarum]MCZ8537603.1 arginine--tRNA ligase [Paenisporosarcina quisquiliarum]
MKQKVMEVLQAILAENIEDQMIEVPVYTRLGDYALPCFPLAKKMKKSPVLIAEEIAALIKDSSIEKAEAVNGYVNIFMKRTGFTQSIMNEILSDSNQYGSSNIGNGRVITIDMSSPNIAKPFSMGHLRSTVIGNSISLLHEKSGFQPVKINYLGDWGTQFGKLLVAYRLWGNEKQVQEKPIESLLMLYIRFHKEAEQDESLNDKGRAAFKSLEDGDPEALALWKWFRTESLKEFQKIYDLLGVSFDSYQGEAYYNDKMEPIVEELNQKNLLMESNGALVVDVGEHMPPCLIKKSDGATLYATRDITAAIDRFTTHQFAKSLYVVGNEQSLHFAQLKIVLNKMGYEWADSLQHIPFGLILKNGKKLSTREGKIVLLEEVLKEAIQLAEANIEEKNPKLLNKKEIAQAVGVGAIIFSDLKQHRKHDIEFDLKKMLQTEGETGPYLQYSYARACSILRKAGEVESFHVTEVNDHEWEVIKQLEIFPQIVSRATTELDPSVVAKYAVSLAQTFNSYYGNVQIVTNSNLMEYRVSLVHCVVIVLGEALRLLGIQAPEEM